MAAAVVLAAVAGGTAQAQQSTAPTLMFNPSGQVMAVDPLAAQMLSGTAVPLTRSQAGVSAVSSAQQFTGIGSGRFSGVRGAVDAKAQASQGQAGSRRATLRAPGGQASVYFNRSGRETPPKVSTPVGRTTTRNFYNRPAGFFPEGVR
ncbi:hypothetical protein [Paludisphaera rhizosphaerae]|uniref:hypothetical protein n=1 Tax=Paludisphaera rhizosphaerae TaxID=2711216 RepID=UPI0013EB2D99|nr:hypothetical protein [Paludisphaera rhizosphaerae]